MDWEVYVDGLPAILSLSLSLWRKNVVFRSLLRDMGEMEKFKDRGFLFVDRVESLWDQKISPFCHLVLSFFCKRSNGREKR